MQRFWALEDRQRPQVPSHLTKIRPAHRDAILFARVVELLPHLSGPRLAFLLLAAIFLLQLLALGDLLLQRGDLIVDIPNQEAREFH